MYNDIRKGTVLGDIDGSMYDTKCAYGFVLKDHNETESNGELQGGNICPHTGLPSSLYAELWGAYGIVLCVNEILKANNHPKEQGNPRIEIYIDNLEVVNRLTKKHILKHNAHHFALTQEIIGMFPVVQPIKWIWIESHTSAITLPHILNGKADIIAKAKCKTLMSYPKWPALRHVPCLVLD